MGVRKVQVGPCCSYLLTWEKGQTGTLTTHDVVRLPYYLKPRLTRIAQGSGMRATLEKRAML